MHLHPTLATTLVTTLLTSAAMAQVVSTNHVIGWITPLGTRTSRIEIQDIAACTPSTTVCGTVLAGGGAPYFGGTAYDPVRRAVWITEGGTLEQRALGSCNVLCTLTATTMNPAAAVSGLAYNRAARLLYQLETADAYCGITLYDDRACPPQILRGGCQLTLQNAEVAGGLAYDEARTLWYVGASQQGPSGPLHSILVVQPGTCNVVCTIPVPGCPNPAGFDYITGLGYDACNDQLYVSYYWLNTQTVKLDLQACTATSGPCCRKQTQEAFGGLDVLPGWTRSDLGTSCVGSSCASCTSMRADLAGDPAIGNLSFALTLANAPLAAGNAFCVVAAGACSAGVPLPPLCNPIYPKLAGPIIVVSTTLTGTGACGGAGNIGVPIPNDPSLCGALLCTQWLVPCASDLAMSQGVQFAIAGA